MELNKNTNEIIKPYPLVEKIVEKLFDDCDSLIKDHISDDSDKSIFMMFVVMYLTIHVKLKDSFLMMSKQQQKDTIKNILTEFIRDPSKRQACLYMFENKFRSIFNVTDSQTLSIKFDN